RRSIAGSPDPASMSLRIAVTCRRWRSRTSPALSCAPGSRKPCSRASAADRSAAALAEPHAPGEIGTHIGIVRSHHRIIGRKLPATTVLLRGHAVLAGKMPLQRLELLAILQADEMVGRHRLADRNRRLGPLL